MKRILGMAKSYLDLVGVKPRNLELDFLRLIYAVEHFRASGDQAQGYLLVLTEPIRTRVRGWVIKYKAQDCVHIIVPPLTEEQDRLLREEKNLNSLANVKGAARAHASAAYGMQLGENALRQHILKEEPGVEEKAENEGLFGIRWDFYGYVCNAADSEFFRAGTSQTPHP